MPNMCNAVVVGTTFLLVSCAGLTPAQRAAVGPAQQYADLVAEAYGVPRVIIMVGIHPADEGGTMRAGGLLTIAPAWLNNEESWLAVVSHEMAHWVRGDVETYERLWLEAGGNRAAFNARVREIEMEADFLSIEILRRVRGWTEARAVNLLHRKYAGFKRAIDGGKGVQHDGHFPPCEKFARLKARYPAQAGLTTCQGAPR